MRGADAATMMVASSQIAAMPSSGSANDVQLYPEDFWRLMYVESDQVAARAAELAASLQGQPESPDRDQALCACLFHQAYHAARRWPLDEADARLRVLEAALPPGAGKAWTWLFADAKAFLAMRRESWDEARELQAPLRDPPVAAQRPAQHRCVTLNILGHLESRSGHAEEGLRFRFLHLHEARAAKLVPEEAVAWTNVADSHGSMFNMDDALAAQERAFELWNGILKPRVRGVTAANLLFLCYVTGKHEQARQVLARWQGQPGGIPKHELELFSPDIALVLMEQGDMEEAGALLPDEFVDELTLIVREPQWAIAKVEWHQRRGELARGREILDKTLRSPSKPISPQYRVWLLDLLSRVCEELGDFGAALNATREAQKLTLPLVRQSTRGHVLSLRWASRTSTDLQEVSNERRRLGFIERMLNDYESEIHDAPASAEPGAKVLDVARVSHDMRSPLNGVLGMTSLLLMSNLDERQKRFAMLTRSSAESLLLMINDIVDLARMEHGQLKIKPEPVDMRQLSEDIAEVYRAQVPAKGVAIRFHCSDDLPPVVAADKQRLRQVIGNLMSNAIKFTKKGHVELAVTLQRGEGRDHVCVAVEDSGLGISREEQQSLFEEFYQSSSGRQHAGTGSGLGLAICKRIVQAMGGSLDFSSTEGQGSRFWFLLPLAAA